MEIHISNFDATVWIALILAVLFTITTACLGFSTRFSRTKTWRITLGILAAVTILLIPLAFHHAIQNELQAENVQRYTFHPSVPTTYDGLLFPPGATVVEDPDPPHTVISGTVPDNTPLLGLTIHGDFTISHSSGGRELVEAILSTPGRIHDVPCASGPFKIERNMAPDSNVSDLNCTLATNYTIDGLTLKADTNIHIALDHSTLNGTLAAPWKASAAECAPGGFFYSSTLLECTLLHDTVISGYPLSAGHEASIVIGTDGARTLYSGTLSRPFRILGVDVPAGSEISSSGELPSAERLLAHDLSNYQSVDFRLPESAHLVIAGADIRGRVLMSFGAHTFGVNVDTFAADDQVAALHHDGVTGEHGTYDVETKTWCWEHAC